MEELYDIYFDKEKKAYAFEIENPICVIKSDLWEQYAGTDKWDIINGEFVDVTDTKAWQKKQEEDEHKRVEKLTCTKRVFVLLLEELGLDYFKQVQPLIEANRQAKLEWELCVELERKNPLLEIMGAKLNLTSEQLDLLFKVANGESGIEILKATVK